MNIVFLGAPGAGKGTQASMLAKKYQIPHISTGDIFRQNIKDQTPIGLVAKGYIDRGQLVPDEVTVELVKGRICQDDCVNGFILDGFPRDVAQAEALANFAKIDAVIDIVIPLDRLTKRLTGRRICAKCGESYHVDFLGGVSDCSKCGGELIQRADDTVETVQNRLNVYTVKTAPVIEFYENTGLLKDVNGDQPVQDVFQEIIEVLNDLH